MCEERFAERERKMIMEMVISLRRLQKYIFDEFKGCWIHGFLKY